MTEMDRVLVAVADSRPRWPRLGTAVDLAARLHGELRAIHVVADGDLTTLLEAAGRQAHLTERRGSAAVSVLRHVRRAGRPGRCAGDDGAGGGRRRPRSCDQARDWPADLIVVGRTTRRGAGDPFIGIEAQRVLEFCDRPVLLVPG